jgi:DNA-binding XRE family transcriptional regulator
MSDTYPDELEPFIADQRRKDPAFAAAWETRENRESIIGALLARRRELGLTQADVADAMGVTQATVSEFESADVDPRLATIVRYARAVHCTLEISLSPTDIEVSGPDA